MSSGGPNTSSSESTPSVGDEGKSLNDNEEEYLSILQSGYGNAIDLF